MGGLADESERIVSLLGADVEARRDVPGGRGDESHVEFVIRGVGPVAAEVERQATRPGRDPKGTERLMRTSELRLRGRSFFSASRTLAASS